MTTSNDINGPSNIISEDTENYPEREHAYHTHRISWWHWSECKDTLVIDFGRYERRKAIYKKKKKKEKDL